MLPKDAMKEAMESGEFFMENMFKMILDGFPSLEVPKEMLNTVIHGFPLGDVKPIGEEIVIGKSNF